MLGSRLRTRALALLTLTLGVVLATTAGALANLPILQISSDPYTNPTSQHRTEVEPDTFAFGSTVVSAFQVGRFFDGGASNIGFSTSTDAGASFTQGFLPATTFVSTPPGPYERLSDPVVAFDARHGTWLLSYLGLRTAGGAADVLVSRSPDGITWGTPIVILANNQFNDKNWTVCDNTASSPYYGHCYTTFDDNSQFNLILTSTSTDGGLTWGPALATTNKGHGIGGQPVVQPNGRVILPFIGFSAASYLLMATMSNDGGASWAPAIVITPVKFHLPAGNLRANIPMPSAEIDSAGRVYVVWSDCRFEPKCSASDLVLTTTTDGRIWSRPTRIPADPVGSGVDHFIPGLAVDPQSAGATARLVLTFYYYPVANCTVSTCQLSVAYVSSTNAGASWTTRTDIAGPMSLTWLADTNQGRMVGDYISTSFSGGHAVPVFAVAKAPVAGVFDEAMYTAAGGLTVGVGTTVAATDRNDGGPAGQPTGSRVTTR